MRSFTQSSAGPMNLAPSVTLAYTGPIPDRPIAPPTHTHIHIPPTACPDPPSVPVPHPFFGIHNPIPLSAQATRHLDQALQGAWAGSTLRRYSGAIRQFIHFCDDEHIPPHLRFPADEFVLCAFAASSIGKHVRGTPQGRLSALKAWHLSQNVEWKGSARLRYVLNESWLAILLTILRQRSTDHCAQYR